VDFTFSEEQQAAVEAARAVFAGIAPDGVPGPALTAGAVADDFDRALWARLADADLREQFGHPIATFQAVAMQAADRFMDLRAMEATLRQAAWRITSVTAGALPAAGDVAVAKIWASEGVRRVVQTAQHLHGGFGADTD
jgi:alkylation response protein AidB-like acyl-CoA dehydrogenase